MKTRRFFHGKIDSDAIVLSRVFPLSDVTFSAPFGERRKHHRVVIEGNERHLEFLEPHFETLVDYTPEKVGEWVAFSPDEITGGCEIYFRPSDTLEPIELMDIVLRRYLILACNLRLAEIAHIEARRNNIVCHHGAIVLPETPPNGVIELPAIVLPEKDDTVS